MGNNHEANGKVTHLRGHSIVPPDVGKLQWLVAAWDDGVGSREGLAAPWKAQRSPDSASRCSGKIVTVLGGCELRC